MSVKATNVAFEQWKQNASDDYDEKFEQWIRDNDLDQPPYDNYLIRYAALCVGQIIQSHPNAFDECRYADPIKMMRWALRRGFVQVRGTIQ
jgi:hypothetical protein